MSVYKKRISSLQSLMKKKNITHYLTFSNDSHSSEYVCAHYEKGYFLSGFSGSDSSILLITQSAAYLWTDGRYFIQAEKELKGSGVILMKLGLDAPVSEFLEQNLAKSDTLLVDGCEITADFGRKIKKICKDKSCILKIQDDIIEQIWEDRPSLPANRINIVNKNYAGKTVAEKLKRVREQIKKGGANSLVLSALDEIMWLFNVRGADIEYNPVALSYAYIDLQDAYLFVQALAVDDKLKEYAAENKIILKDYSEINKFFNRKKFKKSIVLIDEESINYTLFKNIKKSGLKCAFMPSPVEMLKAVKNKTEIKKIKEYFLLDSVAVIKFLYWLETEADIENTTEIQAADKLYAFRKENADFQGLSFSTISAYGANAAMAHYEPDKINPVKLKKQSFLLVDSGAQYPAATTDVTRTIPLGELTKEEIKGYTLVAAGWANLMDAVFIDGATGRNIDILAREALWRAGLDFNHGTGHGVGCCLCVHEGPQGIRWRKVSDRRDPQLKAGMLITDEPGLYEEGKFGIRTENTLLVKKKIKSEYGEFLGFETLTYVPIDRRAIDKKYLSQKQIDIINKYHKQVLKKCSIYLEENEKKWLSEKCSEI